MKSRIVYIIVVFICYKLNIVTYTKIYKAINHPLQKYYYLQHICQNSLISLKNCNFEVELINRLYCYNSSDPNLI